MARMTIDDLRRVLVACAGENEGVDMSGDIANVTFDDLGYDSLALMETAAAVKEEFGIDLTDDEIADVTTPAELLDAVNGAVPLAA